MSESRFFVEQLQAFRTSHPADEGWKVYQYHRDLAVKLHMRYLLDCLRDLGRRPLQGEAIRMVKDEEILASGTLGSECEPGTDRDLDQELDSVGWKGSVGFMWEGCPIHFVSLPLKRDEEEYLPFCLAASTSNAALRSFQRILKSYGDKRERDEMAPQGMMAMVHEWGKTSNLPVTPTSWDDVILPSDLKEGIVEETAAFFASRGRYARLGIPYRRGMIFSGPPGCGKTLTLKALASRSSAKVISILGEGYLPQTSSAFELAGKLAPAVLIFEDLDRQVGKDSFDMTHFLNLVDGFRTTEGVLIIATCNDLQRLDPALLHRPGRFDRIWKFPLPGQDQRLELLQKRGGDYFSEATLRQVARQTHRFSMAYVQEIIVGAFLTAAHANREPSDMDLLESFSRLRRQRKEAVKSDEPIEDRQEVGFLQGVAG